MTDLRFGAPRVATYAGHSRIGDEVWAYVVQLAPGDSEEPPATLLRTSLSDGRQERLLSFNTTAGSVDGILTSPSAAVSPDGGSVAYTDVDGLKLLDLASSTSRLLVQDACPTGVYYEKGCTAFTWPLWSPDGTRILVSERRWEGSIAVLVDPAMGDVARLDDVGGDVKAWSPDGSWFCATNIIYSPGGFFIVSADGNTRTNIGETIPGKPNSCAWAPDGRLAVGFTREVRTRMDLDITAPRFEFLIRPAGSLARSEKDVLPFLESNGELVAWTPAGDGIVIRHEAFCEPDPCRPPVLLSGTYYLGGLYEGIGPGHAAVLGFIPQE